MNKQTCADKVRAELKDRLTDIRKLWKLYQEGCDASDPDLGRFNEYGLGFDYVAPRTFNDQKRGYCRWQLSWGGPADEFRFYLDENRDPVEIEYWFLDWFDGAKVDLRGRDYDLLAEIFYDFKGMGMVDLEIEKARE